MHKLKCLSFYCMKNSLNFDDSIGFRENSDTKFLMYLLKYSYFETLQQIKQNSGHSQNMIYSVAQKQHPEVHFINIPLDLIFFSKTLCCLWYNIYINILTKIDS